MLQNRLSIE